MTVANRVVRTGSMTPATTLPTIGKAQGVEENDAETEALDAGADASGEPVDNGPTGGQIPAEPHRTRTRTRRAAATGGLPGVPTNMPQLAPATLQGLGLLFVLARASGTTVELMADGMRAALAAYDALNAPPQE